MKNNKLICVILALLVCLSMVVSASATEEADLILALESADSSVEGIDAAVVPVGDEFTVTLDIVKNPGIKKAYLKLEFDAEKLEMVSIKSNDTKNVKVTETGYITIGTYVAWGSGETITATGSVVEMVFKVKAEVEAEDQLTIGLIAYEDDVCDANGKWDVLSVEASALKINPLTAAHVCDETKTVEANAKEPNCTEAGKKADLLCEHCGETLTVGEEIAPNGHAWGEFVITTPSTCDKYGVQTRTCSVCEETEVDEYSTLAEHTFGDWTVKTPASVEAEGVEARTCSGCGAEETRSIEKLPAPAPVEPAPKNNTALIVIIVVVVLAGAGVAAFFVLKNKKK